jgi:hypothetical protein
MDLLLARSDHAPFDAHQLRQLPGHVDAVVEVRDSVTGGLEIACEFGGTEVELFVPREMTPISGDARDAGVVAMMFGIYRAFGIPMQILDESGLVRIELGAFHFPEGVLAAIESAWRSASRPKER